MALARSRSELRRWHDLTAIRGALKSKMPECETPIIGLAQVAELCRRHARQRPACNWIQLREELLTLACEWRDQQSDACLAYLASFLAER